MGNFNRNEKSWGNKGGGHGGFRGGSGGGFGGRKFGGGGGGGGGFGKSRMFSAVCSDCGDNCEVPFKPTGDKPVLCSRCFGHSGRGSGGPKREFRPQRFEERPKATGPSNEELKIQIEKLNAKLDRILKILAPVVTPEAKEAEEVKEVKEVKAEKRAAKKPVAKTEKKAKDKLTKKAKVATKKKPAKKS